MARERCSFLAWDRLFFLLFVTGVWTPTLIGIALMFGGGNAFDSVVSWAVYRWFRRRMA